MKKLLAILGLAVLMPLSAQANIWDSIKNWWNPQPQEINLGATILFPSGGGTGTSTLPQAGQLLIGLDGNKYGLGWLTPGTNITISTSSGGITINSTASGSATSTATINNVVGPIFTFNTSTAGFLISTSTATITFGITEYDAKWVASSTSYVNWANASTNNWSLAYGWGDHRAMGYFTSSTESDPVWTAAKSGYMTTFATSVFALNTTLGGYMTTFATSVFALNTTLGGYMTTFATSVFAVKANNLSDLQSTSTARTNLGLVIGTDVMSNFATSVFALNTTLSGYMTTFATSVFALNTTLSGYMTTFATSVFPLKTNNLSDLSNTTTAALTLGLPGLYVRYSDASSTRYNQAWDNISASSSKWNMAYATSLDPHLNQIAGLAHTTGNLIVGTTTNGWNTLGVGTDSYVLTVSSTAPLGIAWIPAPASSLSGGSTNMIAYWTSATALGYVPGATLSTIATTGTAVLWTSASTTNWDKAYGIVNASSSNWDKAYGWGDHRAMGYYTSSTDIYWTGVSTNLVAATGRTSLGLGDAALLASSTWVKAEVDPIWNAASSSFVKWGVASTSNWDKSYGIVNASSSNWDKTYGIVNASSSNWDKTYGIVNASSSNWDQGYSYRITGTSTAGLTVGSNQIGLVGGLLNMATLAQTKGNIIAGNGSWTALAVGTDGFVLTASSSAATGMGWQGVSGGGASLSGGQTNFIPKWTSATALATTTIYDSSGSLGIGTTSPSSVLQVWGTTTARGLIVNDGSAKAIITIGKVGAPACLKIRDSADTGWTYCQSAAGVLACSAVSCE